jgi:serine protease Do
MARAGTTRPVAARPITSATSHGATSRHPGARAHALRRGALAMLVAVGACGAAPATLHAQQPVEGGGPDSARFRREWRVFETRMRTLQQKLQRQLDDQARVLQGLERDLALATTSDGRVRDSVLRAAEPRVAATAEKLAAVQGEIEQVTRRQLERDVAQGAVPGLAPGSPEARTLVAAMARDYAQMTRELTTMARALAAQQASLAWRASSERPRGRMGVTLSGDQEVTLRGGRVTTRYRGPQVVESVEPGGPADKAGVEAGDTLLALGRHRLADAEVPLAELLVPGEKLAVRVRRKGQERTLNMTVGERAATFAWNAAFPAPAPPSAMTLRGTVDVAAPPRPPQAPQSPATNIVAGTTSWAMSYDGSMGGAVLATIDADLEELVGAAEGAFVLRVAPGTPAAEAGLRSGDVIVRVDDAPVATPRDVRRAMQRTAEQGGKALVLVVVRKGQSRTVQLKW